MRTPEELLRYLRGLVNRYPEIQIPESTSDKILYIKNFTSYNTELATEIANSCLAYPLDSAILAELVGRYKVLHYYLGLLDGMSIESVLSIRGEIRKREALYRSLKRVVSSDREITLTDLKVLMSALVRVIIEFEKSEEVPVSLQYVSRVIFESVNTKFSETNQELLTFLFLGG